MARTACVNTYWGSSYDPFEWTVKHGLPLVDTTPDFGIHSNGLDH